MTQSEKISALATRVGSEFKKYLPLAGGTMTGALNMGGKHINGAKYVYGQWFNIGAGIASSSPASEILIKQGGWIYSRTPAQILSDIGAASASELAAIKETVSTADEDYGDVTGQPSDVDYGSI